MRKFDVAATEKNPTAYWSASSQTAKGWQGVPNYVTNSELDSNGSGFNLSNGAILKYVVDDLGNGVFRATPSAQPGTAVAIRYSTTYNTNPGDQWYLKCRIRVSPDATFSSGYVNITAEYFTDGANAVNVGVNGTLRDVAFLPKGEWIELAGTITVPAGRNGLRFRQFFSGDISGDGYIDSDSFDMRPLTGTNILSSTGNMVLGFESNALQNNRNITSDSGTSINVGSNRAQVAVGEAFSDFALAGVLYPSNINCWVVKFKTFVARTAYTTAYGQSYFNEPEDNNLGVRLNDDSTVSLLWQVGMVRQELRVPFFEQVSYFSLTCIDGVVSMQLNDRLVSIEGDKETFMNFELGDNTANSLLMDKISFNLTGNLPAVREYFTLFRNQRLDNVARPNGAASFVYINDIVKPQVTRLTNTNFSPEDGFFYSGYANGTGGLLAIDKRTPFVVDYSVDQGITWQALATNLRLTSVYDNIIFRHAEETEQRYYIEVRSTPLNPEIPLAFFDVDVSGSLHLAESVAEGYYNTDASDAVNATIRINRTADNAIRTLEFLGSVDDLSNILVVQNPLQVQNYALYINGEVRSLTTVKPDQIYHFVVVFESNLDWVEINPNKIVGFGASSIAYTQSDAYYIYNVFAGNTFTSALESVGKPKDGLAPNAVGVSPGAALQVQWNS